MKKITLGITGEIASGKDTVAKYLVDCYGAVQFRTSDIFRDVLKTLYVPETRESIAKMSQILRQNFGDDLVARVIHERIKKADAPFIVVDGVRRFSDILLLKNEPHFSLLFVEAPMELRYNRLTQRRQNADDATKTFEEFQHDHERETEVSINSLKLQANHLISNEGGKEELFAKIDAVIKKLDPNGEVCKKKEASS
nr:AAA domain protein [uncultured bacterium]